MKRIRVPGPGVCKAEGCESLTNVGGYCHGHYHRLKRYGDPLWQPKRGPTAFEVLSPVIGDDLARSIVAMREAKDRTKAFDAYRAGLTLAKFQRASDPKLAAWENLNREANNENLTLEYLKACVTYDAETGIFRARLPMAKRQEGDVLGSLGSHGYLTVSVGKTAYLAHRLAWFYQAGKWPDLIDHIDRDRHNNRFANLRECTYLENAWNVTPIKGTASGVTGVTWYAKRGKWVAKISSQGVSRTLGYFDTIEDAANRRAQAVEAERGQFLNMAGGCQHG